MREGKVVFVGEARPVADSVEEIFERIIRATARQRRQLEEGGITLLVPSDIGPERYTQTWILLGRIDALATSWFDVDEADALFAMP